MTALNLLQALAVPCILGWVIVLLLWQAPAQRRQAWLLLTVALSPLVGYALTSALYFLWVLWQGPQSWLAGYRALEWIVLFACAGILLWKKGNKIRWPQTAEWFSGLRHSRFSWWQVTLGVFFCWYSLSFFSSWWHKTLYNPVGSWDAWAIWNLKARFLYSGDTWQRMFSPLISTSHLDYPLLLPASIARAWVLLGSRSPLVGAGIGLLFQVLIVIMLFAWTWQQRGIELAWLAGIFGLVAAGVGLDFMQYADIPLAAYFLAANATLLGWEQDNNNLKHRTMLAGLLMGAMPWLKNEGWIILFTILVSRLALAYLQRNKTFLENQQTWLWMGVGILPLLLITLFFKFSLAPANDMVEGLAQGVAKQIFEPDRYGTIWHAFVEQFFTFGNLKIGLLPLLLFYILIVGVRMPPTGRRELARLGLTLLLTGGAYFGVYVLSYADLTWHLERSLGRLVAHLVPSLLLCVFAVIAPIGEPVLTGEEISSQ